MRYNWLARSFFPKWAAMELSSKTWWLCSGPCCALCLLRWSVCLPSPTTTPYWRQGCMFSRFTLYECWLGIDLSCLYVDFKIKLFYNFCKINLLGFLLEFHWIFELKDNWVMILRYPIHQHGVPFNLFR